jgi:hypothetical protein
MQVSPLLRVVTIAAASWLCAAAGHAQAPCGPDDTVERIYTDLRFLRPAPLESNQLFGDFGGDTLIELARHPDRAQWYLDAWRENARPDLSGLTLSALRKTPGFRPRKLGWDFSPRGEPVLRVETIGGRSRCTASFVFTAVRVWRVRVIAEPRGTAPQVSIDCGACEPGAKTDFTTRWVPDGDSISMSANFGRVCKVEMAITQADLPLSLSLETLYNRLSRACGGIFGISQFRPNLPVGGISIQLVPPQ